MHELLVGSHSLLGLVEVEVLREVVAGDDGVDIEVLDGARHFVGCEVGGLDFIVPDERGGRYSEIIIRRLGKSLSVLCLR